MPIYEYYCPDNHRIYSFFARGSGLSDRTPRCPDNAEFRMEKSVSRFAVTRSGTDGGDGAEDDDLDPRMDRMMADMEKEMAALDDDNPDPRAMAGMMRRIAEATGKRLPDSMEEMIRRLESGEDPERLEEEFGDMEDMDDWMDDDALEIQRRLRSGFRREPSRDPALYELADYL